MFFKKSTLASQNRLKSYSYDHPVRNNHPLKRFLKIAFFIDFFGKLQKFSTLNFAFKKYGKRYIYHI